MCRLLAISAAKPIHVNAEVSAFLEGSRLHRHGWGWANFTPGRTRIRREPLPACESAYARTLLAEPLLVSNAFWHIRYATVGAVEIENAHPLTSFDLAGRQWSIIHNGTIFNFDKLNPFFAQQRGSTDTERLLLYLIDRVNARIVSNRIIPDEKQRFSIVTKVLTEAARGNKLNVIIWDGNVMYVHGNSRSGSKALGDVVKNDYLYELDSDDGKLFCTVPLDERAWKPVPLNTVSAYQNGALIHRSAAHEYEYIESDSDMKYMYSGFAAL